MQIISAIQKSRTYDRGKYELRACIRIAILFLCHYIYLTKIKLLRLMEDCAEKVGGVNAWRFSPYQPSARLMFWRCNRQYTCDHPSRKPHAGMIFDLMDELGYSANDTVMVGDAQLDKKCAQAAGVQFIPAEHYFDDHKNSSVK